MEYRKYIYLFIFALRIVNNWNNLPWNMVGPITRCFQDVTGQGAR